MGLDAEVPQIKLRKVEGLVAYHNNARTHSPAQIKQLQAPMIEFGFTNPILVDAMGLVAGHAYRWPRPGLPTRASSLFPQRCTDPDRLRADNRLHWLDRRPAQGLHPGRQPRRPISRMG